MIKIHFSRISSVKNIFSHIFAFSHIQWINWYHFSVKKSQLFMWLLKDIHCHVFSMAENDFPTLDVFYVLLINDLHSDLLSSNNKTFFVLCDYTLLSDGTSVCLCVFLLPSQPPQLSPSVCHCLSFIDICHLPCHASLFPPSFFHSSAASGRACLYFLWRERGPEDGWEDGRQRDGERERCSFGLVYLINYVLLPLLATLHLIFRLLQTHTRAHTHTSGPFLSHYYN